jgi:hypothetical protein
MQGQSLSHQIPALCLRLVGSLNLYCSYHYVNTATWLTLWLWLPLSLGEVGFGAAEWFLLFLCQLSVSLCFSTSCPATPFVIPSVLLFLCSVCDLSFVTLTSWNEMEKSSNLPHCLVSYFFLFK